MAQRHSGYERKPNDRYLTPPWPVHALVPHIPRRVKYIWEPACGDGGMAKELKRLSYKVIASDIADGLDFLTITTRSVDGVVTNPPNGPGGRLAEKFCRHALEVTRRKRGFVAMLLKSDFDSGVTRRDLFADNPAFAGRIVLLHRIEFFKSVTGNSSSSGHTWFVWDWCHRGAAAHWYAENPSKQKRRQIGET
jgi:hypothetical protein